MDNYSYKRSYQQKKKEKAQRYRVKALDPKIRHCYILDIDVPILIEYPDYKNANVKGPEGEIFCSNILNCYRDHVKCRWSGISPHYPDPFISGRSGDEPIVF